MTLYILALLCLAKEKIHCLCNINLCITVEITSYFMVFHMQAQIIELKHLSPTPIGGDYVLVPSWFILSVGGSYEDLC